MLPSMNPTDDFPPPDNYADILREAVLEAEAGAAKHPTNDAARFYAMGLRLAAGLYGLAIGSDPETRHKLGIPDRPTDGS